MTPNAGNAVYKMLSPTLTQTLESSAPEFTVKFTEDMHGFYLNDKKYSPTDGPMLTVTVGHYVHWRVVNHSYEIHPFHIHQVHFLVYQENGKKANTPEWLNTVNVTPDGSVDLIMDFTDPIICRRSLEMSCPCPLEMSGSKDGLDFYERTRSETDRSVE